jgi:hypothetical protein
MSRRENSDETYVIDICDQVLRQRAERQASFDFLRGDSRKRGPGKGRMLPCDAYYPELNLVIEYHERQHSESVPIFDRRETVSGVPRGAQRKMYDDRRRDILPANGLNLIVFDVSQFTCGAGKRLKRDRVADDKVIRACLINYM